VKELCASTARARGEPVLGTASRARRWILLEQPGPWGVDALRESDLPGPVADRLATWARELPARILLLRRPERERPVGTERALYVGSSRAPDHWLESVALGHVDEVLDLDLSGLHDGHTVGGVRVVDPLYLVCTNGKHDPCCAKYGLPVARALRDLVGARVWECSHVGGDRFAGNVVCLPDGLFYGRLDAETARAVVAAHEGGRVAVPYYRGRSSYPFAVQAADVLVRERLGIQGIDALQVVGVERDADRVRVYFRGPAATRIDAEVAVRRDGAPVPLTCSGPPSVAPRYELIALHEA